MKLFEKLTGILFDPPEEDIPVITKEKKEKPIEEPIRREPIRIEDKIPDDEVKVTKIESSSVEDDLFDDMPKFKSEEEPPKRKPFSFPLIDDDDEEENLGTRSKKETKEEAPKSRGFDFLSNKDYKKKSDSYTSSRNNIYEPSSDSKKPFVPSPVISPVWGVLNENYKKEDIIAKDSSSNRNKVGKIDLDSVRRKAYGTLEDEIEVSLNKSEDESKVIEEERDMTIDTLKEDGLSISDLLVDEEDEREEVFEIDGEEVEPEIDIDDEVEDTEQIEKVPDYTEENIEEPVEDIVEEIEPHVDKEINKEEKNETAENEAIGEDDLFDLIDSIYAGKDEE